MKRLMMILGVMGMIVSGPGAASAANILYHSMDDLTDLSTRTGRPGDTILTDNGSNLKVEWARSADPGPAETWDFYGGWYAHVCWNPEPGYSTGQTYDLTGTTLSFDILWNLVEEGRPAPTPIVDPPDPIPLEDRWGSLMRIYSGTWNESTSSWTTTGEIAYIESGVPPEGWVRRSYLVDVPPEDQGCYGEAYDYNNQWWVAVPWEDRSFDVTSVYKIRLDATNWNWTEGDYLLLDELMVPPIPEPATMGLLGCGGFGVLLRRRRR